MLLTCSSLLVTRKTGIEGRGYSVLRLNPSVTWHSMKHAFIHKKWQKKRRCLNFRYRNRKCFKTLESFITFYKPVCLLPFSAKSWTENGRSPCSGLCTCLVGVSCLLTAAATASVLVTTGTTIGTAGTQDVSGDSSCQHVLEACLLDFQASPFSHWLWGVKLF